MLPLLLALILFGHFALTGWALQAVVGAKLGRTRSWLLAPAVGFSFLTLAGMTLNQAGLPFENLAGWLLGVSLVASGIILWQKRATAPRGLWRTLLVLIGVLGLAGWPLLCYQWSWVGYGNDDMANYCLGAQRFLDHGFYSIPAASDLAAGDYAQAYWMLHVAGQMRFGSEMLLAYVSGAFGLKPTAAFTPTLLALALSQLTSFMALAGNSGIGRRTALVTAIAVGVAPLWHASINYQLIAQLAGLSLLAAGLVLVARSRFPRSGSGQVRVAAISAVLLAGMSIFYPEVLPFLVLAWGLYLVVQVIVRRRWIGGVVPTAVLALGFIVVLLRQNVVSTAITLLEQSTGGIDIRTSLDRAALFPYFLMPSGAAFLLGFDVFVARYPEPCSSVAIVGGLFALGVAALIVTWGVRRRFNIGTAMLVVMLPIGIIFFRGGNGFGLFKLAMFALPFLLTELARRAAVSRRRWLWLIPSAPLLAVWIFGATRYSLTYTTLDGQIGGEMLNASTSRGVLPDQPAWSDIASAPINKLLMLDAPTPPTAFLSQLVIANLIGKSAEPYPDWVWRTMPGPADGSKAQAVAQSIQDGIYRKQHALGLHFWEATAAARDPRPHETLITSLAERRAFNKVKPDAFAPTDGLFTHAPIGALENHAVFVQSDEGQHYYLGSAGHISVYRSQPDVFNPTDHFFAVGRHLLIRVLNPTETIRVRLALSATVLGKGRTSLPSGAVVRGGADTATRLDFVGSGGANVYSPPLTPAWINGAAYVAIDLGQDPIPLGLPAEKIQGIYNRNLSLDTRLALGYCRDISIVSEPEYQARTMRREITTFPAEILAADNPEYSGFYEDGWVSGHAYIMLGPVHVGDRISVSAQMPQKPADAQATTEVELLADGVVLQTTEIISGALELEARLPAPARQVKIELRFNHTEPLPAPDDRPISVLLKAIKIIPSP